MAWDKTKPQGPEALAKGDNYMRANCAWLEMVLASAMVFPGDETTLGRATVSRHTQATRDALTPVDRLVIVRTDKPALEYYDLATTSWVTFDFAFTGQIKELAFSPASPPEGWLACDGSDVSRENYSLLFAAIGTVFGVGDDSTTFGLPDLGGKVPVGQDTGEAAFVSVGTEGGVKEITLAAEELADHSHTAASDGDHGYEPNAGGGGTTEGTYHRYNQWGSGGGVVSPTATSAKV